MQRLEIVGDCNASSPELTAHAARSEVWLETPSTRAIGPGLNQPDEFPLFVGLGGRHDHERAGDLIFVDQPRTGQLNDQVPEWQDRGPFGPIQTLLKRADQMSSCSVCRRRIRGRAHRWNYRPFCLKCYQYFTRRVRVTRSRRPQKRVPGFLRWLFG